MNTKIKRLLNSYTMMKIEIKLTVLLNWIIRFCSIHMRRLWCELALLEFIRFMFLYNKIHFRLYDQIRKFLKVHNIIFYIVKICLLIFILIKPYQIRILKVETVFFIIFIKLWFILDIYFGKELYMYDINNQQKKIRVLITGATGFIGNRIVKRLLANE